MKKPLLKKTDCIFLLVLAAYLVFLGVLYVHEVRGDFFSDMPAYIWEIKGLDSGYSFPYRVFFRTSQLFYLFMPIEGAITTTLLIFQAVSMIAVYVYCKGILHEKLNQELINSIISTIAVFAVFAVSMLFLPKSLYTESEWGYFRYLGVFSPNPLHNATYIATRPWSILLLLQFVKFEEGSKSLKDYVLLGLWLLLSVMTKPSFAILFLPVFGVVLVADAIRARKLSKEFWYACLSAIPAVLMLALQYVSVFTNTGEEDGGIHLGIAVVWHLWCKGIKAAYLKANFFPLVYLILYCKDFLKDRLLRYSWYIHVVGLGMFVLLYEGGFRMTDANFAWGYMHGMFFVFMASIVGLSKKIAEKKAKCGVREWICLLALLAHLICGIFFFIFMINGGDVTKF